MSDLQNIKINEDMDLESVELILRYTRYLAFNAKTPDLRTHWTFVYKWVDKHLRSK